MSDRFGQRFIKQSDFIDYAKFLGIGESFLADILEFAERFCIITPVARVRFPDPVVRRWFRERYPSEKVLEPIEPDGPRLSAANVLRNALGIDFTRRTELTRPHPLDPVSRKHRRFVTTEFTRANFEPWSSHRTPLFENCGQQVGGTECVRTYYHAWQVFQLAAFLRSGITILYDVGSEHSWNESLDLSRSDLRMRIPLLALRELKTVANNAHLFDAVAQFTDCSQRALQTAAVDRRTGRLSSAASRSLRSREVAIATDVFARAKLTPKRVIEFLRVLCGLWSDATQQHPAPVVEAYKQTIRSTIDLLRLARPRNTFRSISRSLGTGGRRHSILNLIFPDWVSEQRVVVERALRHWIVPHLAQMPPEFAFAPADVTGFCDWVEARGFLQFYWHFRRLTDVGRIDDDMGRSAVTLEVIGLASLIEHFITRALADRVPPARREILRDTLPPKLVALLRPTHAAIAVDFERHARLRRTTERTLRQQLDRIRRMRSVGAHTPVLKALLRLVLIRNTSSHAGLAGFNRDEMQTLVESLLIAALVVWMAR